MSSVDDLGAGPLRDHIGWARGARGGVGRSCSSLVARGAAAVTVGDGGGADGDAAGKKRRLCHQRRLEKGKQEKPSQAKEANQGSVNRELSYRV